MTDIDPEPSHGFLLSLLHPTDEPVAQQTSDFQQLLDLADQYCGPIGIGRELFIDLFNEQSDWSFVIQIDALHETACRELMSRLLRLDGRPPASESEISSFVGALSYQGRTSILRLLKMAGVPKYLTDFVEAIRTVRNAFAHDIRSIGLTIHQIIEARDDKSRLLGHLSFKINVKDEVELLGVFRDKPDLVRFVILQQCMLLLFSLHNNLRKMENTDK